MELCILNQTDPLEFIIYDTDIRCKTLLSTRKYYIFVQNAKNIVDLFETYSLGFSQAIFQNMLYQVLLAVGLHCRSVLYMCIPNKVLIK